ncbi:MAG TPA: TylF/MycF/NovP-related O-methyltransferase [Acidimicrobiales bacterium]|nr:TylF/MycF/NovP-related O-methyltransferase [Acidimicrobiales bacterium]
MTTVSPATRRLRRLEQGRRVFSKAIHAARTLAIPALRGRTDHSTLISVATYSPWRTDAAFREVRRVVEDATLLDEMRLYELWRLAGQVGAVEGDVIEVGSWRGGAGCLIASRIAEQAPGATVFLCDTFEGVVKAGPDDPTYQGGEHADASPEMVRALAAELGLSNVEVLVGTFPDDTGAAVEERSFRFVHMDLDVYRSSREAFEWLRPRLAVGSVTVFDDYGFSLTEGARKFVDELEGDPDFVIVHNLNGHAVVVRRSASGAAPRRARGGAGS